MSTNIQQVARNFVNQSVEYLINDVLRWNGSGDFYDHLKKYNIYLEVDELAAEEGWSKKKKEEVLNLAISIIKNEYKERVSEYLQEEKDQLRENQDGIEYYKNKIFLTDGTLEDGEVITDEQIERIVKDREKDIERCKGVINTFEKIMEQLNE